MNSFTISQLQDYSGIKAHTIRIWEQRYNALVPHRSKGNTRYYDGEQLRRLLNIVSLIGTEHKVSKICAMTNKELNALLDKQYQSLENVIDESAELYVSQLISSAFSFDEAQFEKLFDHCVLRFGLQDTYVKVLYPTLQRLGLLWAKDALPPAHEHFITNLIKIKILTAVNALPTPNYEKDSWLLFLPEDEFHEIGLLFAYFLIRHAGHRVFYLGANVPVASLSQTIESIKPANVLGFLVSKKDKKTDLEKINTLGKETPGTKLYLACNAKTPINITGKAHFKLIHSVTEFEQLLAH